MPTLHIQSLLTRMFLTLAYIGVTLQWLWVLAIGLPQLIETGMLDSFTPAAPTEPMQTQQPLTFSPFIAVLAGIVTVVFLLISIIIVIKLPKTISNTGKKIVEQSTESIIPLITQHKKLPIKKKRLLSRRITKALQLLLIALPCIISFFIPPVQMITSQIITTLAVWLAIYSVCCFAISWLLEPKTTSQTQLPSSHE